ncbi:hypothetical protein [uncultured Ruegeria sp.]|uniref:hypothetical protein n=1 Tax=uncultured Ruegeria sp. TaxID=259304 RepID=UPI002621D4BF|nr:hypothetical protein [uncultured Ruegeria sp.]
MTTVIFVHGISNMPEKDVLIHHWYSALATDYAGNEGVDLKTRAYVKSVHWADIMYATPLGWASIAESSELSLESTGALSSGGPDLGEVDDAFLRTFAEDMNVDPEALLDSERVPLPSDLSGIEAEAIPLPWFLKKPLMRAAVRDTHHYLYNVAHSPRPGETYKVRDVIRGRFVDELKAAETRGPIILITHSMGTVIAYDCLKNVPDCPQIKHLMTVGSPLGLSEVQTHLKPGYTRHDGYAYEKIGLRWVNIFDPVDIVARADPKLRNDYLKSGGEVIEDIRQNNGGLWTHSFTKYAPKKTMRDVLRELL